MFNFLRLLIKKLFCFLITFFFDYLGIYKVIKKISACLITRRLNSLNWSKTVLANFTFFHWKDALRFPIIIYGPVDFGGIQGRIILHCPVRKGLIKIGRIGLFRCAFDNRTYLRIDGDLHINELIQIKRGAQVAILHGATVKLGAYVNIGFKSKFTAHELIEIGDHVRIGYESVISDSDFHYTMNTETGLVKPRTSPIKIGNYNWITSYSHIKKGVITPDYFILAGPNSMINKDYTKLSLPPYPLFAGSPAKLISHGIQQISNGISEIKLQEYYQHHETPFVIDDFQRMMEFCVHGTYFQSKNQAMSQLK